MTHTHQPVFTGAALWVHSGSLARFEKCNVNSPDSSAYLEKLLFECKIHCKTLPFKRTKTKIKKKICRVPTTTTSECMLQQRLTATTNLNQFGTISKGGNEHWDVWFKLNDTQIKMWGRWEIKTKKTSIPINTDTLGEDLQLVFQTLVHE